MIVICGIVYFVVPCVFIIYYFDKLFGPPLKKGGGLRVWIIIQMIIIVLFMSGFFLVIIGFLLTTGIVLGLLSVIMLCFDHFCLDSGKIGEGMCEQNIFCLIWQSKNLTHNSSKKITFYSFFLIEYFKSLNDLQMMKMSAKKIWLSSLLLSFNQIAFQIYSKIKFKKKLKLLNTRMADRSINTPKRIISMQNSNAWNRFVHVWFALSPYLK